MTCSHVLVQVLVTSSKVCATPPNFALLPNRVQPLSFGSSFSQKEKKLHLGCASQRVLQASADISTELRTPRKSRGEYFTLALKQPGTPPLHLLLQFPTTFHWRYCTSPANEQCSLNIQGVPKNALSECYWTNSTLAQSSEADTPCVWKSIFWLFLTKTKQDQALPSHVYGKIWPHIAQFWLFSPRAPEGPVR